MNESRDRLCGLLKLNPDKGRDLPCFYHWLWRKAFEWRQDLRMKHLHNGINSLPVSANLIAMGWVWRKQGQESNALQEVHSSRWSAIVGNGRRWWGGQSVPCGDGARGSQLAGIPLPSYTVGLCLWHPGSIQVKVTDGSSRRWGQSSDKTSAHLYSDYTLRTLIFASHTQKKNPVDSSQYLLWITIQTMFCSLLHKLKSNNMLKI